MDGQAIRHEIVAVGHVEVELLAEETEELGWISATGEVEINVTFVCDFDI